jgi:hemin uptake protein HemP
MNELSASPRPEGAVLPPLNSDAGQSRESWRSDELLGSRDEVFILHNNDVYRLRRTRQGKLILYK